ncbi:MAG: glycosyltransferase, partial [Bdellovibrionales bacterium]|nr:glycosyltransferase [Bdellovibrionales bacterium]
EDFHQVLWGCDMFIVSSPYEGIANSLLEALGGGVPVMAADTPEMREILVHDELLFDPKHVGKLAERLNAYQRSQAVRDRLRALSTERAQALTFDWGQAVDELLLDK